MALLNSTASLICRICTRAATRLLVGRQGRLDQRACGDCGSHLELAGFLTVGTGRTAHPHHAVAAWLRLCRERNIDERRGDRAITGPVIGLQTGYGEANTNQLQARCYGETAERGPQVVATPRGAEADGERPAAENRKALCRPATGAHNRRSVRVHARRAEVPVAA